jgi:membrane-bound ClpP family serine protease
MSNKIEKKEDLAFGKTNYMILIAGVVLVIIGFILMSGGGSDDPNVFSEEIFSFRRWTLAPVVVVLGYIAVFVAIMKKTKDHNQE